jgi:hypothetical protein
MRVAVFADMTGEEWKAAKVDLIRPGELNIHNESFFVFIHNCRNIKETKRGLLNAFEAKHSCPHCGQRVPDLIMLQHKLGVS